MLAWNPSLLILPVPPCQAMCQGWQNGDKTGKKAAARRVGQTEARSHLRSHSHRVGLQRGLCPGRQATCKLLTHGCLCHCEGRMTLPGR